MSSNSHLKVAIIGGGIGGLHLAIALTQMRPDAIVDVYESQPELSEFGAGLGLWPRVQEVLSNVGLEEDINACLPPEDDAKPMEICRGDKLNAQTWARVPGMRGLHRRALLELLAKRASRSPHNATHYSKKLISYVEPSSPEEPIVLTFTDGTRATCDILVGADGVKSAVRASMYAQMADKLEIEGAAYEELKTIRGHVDPVWAGLTLYRYLMPSADLKGIDPKHPSLTRNLFLQSYGRALLTYPIDEGRMINCGALVAQHHLFGTTFSGRWAQPVDQKIVQDLYADFNDQGRAITDLMKTPTLWAVNVVPDLPTYVSGRVAVLGDAAHAMVPYMASGAGQAIEDGYILATLLSRTESLPQLPEALRIYDTIRRPFSQSIQRKSLHVGIAELMDERGEVPLGPTPVYGRLLEDPEVMRSHYQWLLTTSLMPDRDRALEMWEGFRNKLRPEA
ncbi:hypothetical protein BXZ70DRAFT_1046108 [Cristinia sonorae]|uniref:FAD-binding domain-containing protein n=1 Tax=Cristinia sonorae TaxID=1940300 RepID=A0A8K0UHJ0_9AGAR|nr:hypothetical protein BXZ70DRAFT_1046108 [Cristinia sonorae]